MTRLLSIRPLLTVNVVGKNAMARLQRVQLFISLRVSISRNAVLNMLILKGTYLISGTIETLFGTQFIGDVGKTLSTLHNRL